MDERSERGEQETTRIDSPAADSAPTQAFPIVRPAAPYTMPHGSSGTPPIIPPTGSNQTPDSWWKQPKNVLIAVIAALVVVVLIATPIIISRRAKHAEALSACQSALVDYQAARDRLRALATSDSTTSAEATRGTSVTCNANDSTDTLTSSAGVLRDAASAFEAEATMLEQQQKEANKQQDSQNSSDSSDGTDSESAAEARKALQDSLDAANALIDKVQASIADGTAKRLMIGTLNTAVSGAQKLLNDSGVQDSKYYKAAKATLDEAISAVNDWVDKQASKAQ